MKNDRDDDLDAVSRQAEAIEAAVRRALLDHKRTGDPVVFCDGGNVVWVPPEQIPLPDKPTGSI